MKDDVWVIGGMLPMGARVMSPASDGKIWLDVCILGTHLPQQYREEEVTELTPEGCAPLGLCPGCLGYGSTARGASLAGAAVDEIPIPCVTCQGNGRPYVRARVRRTGSAIEIWQDILPHSYVPPAPGCFEACMGCGNAEDHESHHTLVIG